MRLFEEKPSEKAIKKLEDIGMAFAAIEGLVTNFPENIIDVVFEETKPENVFEREEGNTRTIILKIKYLHDEKIAVAKRQQLEGIEQEILRELERIREQKEKI